MKTIFGVCVFFSSLFPVISYAQTCSNESVIVDPEQFDWGEKIGVSVDAHYVGTMEIAYEEIIVGNDNINTRIYRQADGNSNIPGPTLVMKPGEKYVLRFHNLLPAEPRSEERNVFKDPNVSNLHTHGLHISGESPSDDVTRDFAGGEGGDFVYDIPADHMGGTFWYHAHHHGSTFLQVSAGAFGLIVIDDSADVIPDNVANMEERQLVVAYLDPDVAGTGGDTLISGTLSPTWTVNGKVNGDLCMPPDTWQHWRLLLADRDAIPKTVSVGAGCEIALMARDGVWRTEAPKQLQTNSLDLTGASRADLAVRCSSDASISVGSQNVANIIVTGQQGDPLVHPFAAGSPDNYEAIWSAYRPDYLRDLREVTTAINTEKVNMGARTVNGSKFDKNNATFTLPANAVQDWTLKGARNHPFHLHVYHVQVQGDCGIFEDGEYYDVIAGNCNIRFDINSQTTAPYSGRTIMHCHILEHEDQGAMGWLDVQGGTNKPWFPDPDFYGYSELYALGDPPSPPPDAPSDLLASTVSTGEIDLSWADNSTDEDAFDILSSEDGVSFGYLSSVGVDVTNFTDSGLVADTTYWYRVRAISVANGPSADSNTASATTDPQSPGNGTMLQVGSITVSTLSEGRGQKRGQAVVVAKDDTGAPVAGAVVAGFFNQSFDDVITASEETGIDGSTIMLTQGTLKGSVTVGFCVQSIIHPSVELQDLVFESGDEICVSE